MNSVEFVNNWINKMKNKYSNLKIEYTFEPIDNTHYIFLEPIDEYLNGDFGNEAFHFDINEFIPKYPYELLAFLPLKEKLN